jgi:hypothetical protein
MTQHRPFPTRQNSGSKEPRPSDVAVSHRVDASVDAVQPPRPQAVFDRPPPEPDATKLPIGRHPILIRGDLRHHNVGWLAFCMYVMGNASHLTRVDAFKCRF